MMDLMLATCRVPNATGDSKDLQSTEASVSERPVLGLTTGEARLAASESSGEIKQLDFKGTADCGQC